MVPVAAAMRSTSAARRMGEAAAMRGAAREMRRGGVAACDLRPGGMGKPGMELDRSKQHRNGDKTKLHRFSSLGRNFAAAYMRLAPQL